MLRITIELWPRGWADNKRTIATMDVWNDGTGTEDRGNYSYRIYRGGYTGRPNPRLGKQGKLLNYPRLSYPVWELIRRILNGVKENASR